MVVVQFRIVAVITLNELKASYTKPIKFETNKLTSFSKMSYGGLTCYLSYKIKITSLNKCVRHLSQIIKMLPTYR